MAAGIAFPGFITTLLAFILLLLISVSTPVFKQLYFLRVVLSDDKAFESSPSTLILGTLGYCTTFPDVSSANANGFFTNGPGDSGCTPAKLGYQLDHTLFTDGDVWGINTEYLSKAVVKGLTYLLFLQPLAATFAFIALTFTFFAWSCSSRALEILSFIGTTIASLTAWLAWITAMSLFATAKRRVGDASDGNLSATYGNCLWMGLAAALSLSLAICFTFAGTFGSYSKKSGNKQKSYSQVPHQKHGGIKQLVTFGKKSGKQQPESYHYEYQPAASSDSASYPLIPTSQHQPAYQAETIWQA